MKKEKNMEIFDVDAQLDAAFGKEGTPERVNTSSITQGDRNLVHLRRKWKTEVNRLPFFSSGF